MTRAERKAERAAVRTAYHEAGHAVIAVWLHHRIGPVTIRPKEAAYVGRTRIHFSDTRWGGDPTVLLAGYYSEKRRFPSTHWLGGSQKDIQDVGDALDRLFGPSTDENRSERLKGRAHMVALRAGDREGP